MSVMRVLKAALAAVLVALPVQAAVEIREVTSPGGIRAWLVEEPTIPFVALELRFRGGASLDAEGKRGAINLMTALLEEGAGEMDAQQFAAARDAMATSLSFDVGDDALSVSARFLTEHRDASVALLRAALAEPRFDPDAIERVRAQVVSNIRSDLKDPNRIAGRGFDQLAFGDHPYGTARSGTEDSVAALTRDDLLAAKDRVIARDRVYVSAVGDIDAETLGQVIDLLLADLPEAGAPMPPEVAVAVPPGVTVIDYDAPQSVVVFGHEGIDRHDPDFFAAFVLNHILGSGGFGSRLMDELREKRGLTYGVGSYLVPMDLAATYQGSFASANDKVAEAVALVRAEWAKLAENGVSAEELEAAKTYLTGAYPLRFDGNAPIARILVGMQMDDLPVDYVETRNAKVEAVTPEDIRRVAARILKPEALHFVVVGRPEGIAAAN